MAKRVLNFLRQYSDVQSKLKPFRVGDKVTVSKRITAQDVKKFSEISGDTNPIHSSTEHERAIVHGAFLNSLVSGVIGTKLPGAGTIVVSQTLNFPNKCYVGDDIKITVEVVEDRKIVKVNFNCQLLDGSKTFLHGDARLIVKNVGS